MRIKISKVAAGLFATPVQTGSMLTRVMYVFGALTSANTNDNLDAIDSRTAPN